jgi:hypothetical protein
MLTCSDVRQRQQAAISAYHWFCELFVALSEKREVDDITTHLPITCVTYHA